MTTTSLSSRLLQLARLIGRTTVTLVFVAIAIGAVTVGVDVLNERAAAAPAPDTAAPIPVQTRAVEMLPGYTMPRRFTGQIEARTSMPVSFELEGQIMDMPVEEGQRVSAGDVIAVLDKDLLNADIARLNASKAAAAAQLVFAEASLKRANQLQERGFTSRERQDQALSERDALINQIAETDAALEAVRIRLEKSVIYAPFSGQIGTQHADPTEIVRAGQAIVTLIDTGATELRVGLPIDLPVDELSSVTANIGAQSYPATLKFMRPDIDPVTRTRTAVFDVATDSEVLFGQTAYIELDTYVETTGTWVPVDALQSGTGSIWQVMVVEENVLKVASVEIIHIDADRAYVRGSFADGTAIVSAGAHRVVAGQTVSLLTGGK